MILLTLCHDNAILKRNVEDFVIPQLSESTKHSFNSVNVSSKITTERGSRLWAKGEGGRGGGGFVLLAPPAFLPSAISSASPP